MRTHRGDEAGESLLEIVIALVIIGLVVGAFFATYATQGTGSTQHRALVTADAVLRDYAEATKSAVRTQCQNGTTTYTVAFAPGRAGFSVDPLVGQTCPPTGTSSAASQPWPPVLLTVHLPNSQVKSLSVVVRSP